MECKIIKRVKSRPGNQVRDASNPWGGFITGPRPDVLAAREFEVAQMHKWVKQANARRKHVNDSAAA